ncbi:uncharacterized protein LODBEIA_P35000 [Lodderomyces beijingensis]|uniref:Uncharacterized protein n=1 Tax=Lodderomyces beijingensis TaxID=1775926 RepID=A0ABP0ZQ94_9ASCO
MGYPSNLKIATKVLTKDILLASTAFTRMDKINFGARMAVFKFASPSASKVVVWSPLPYSPQVLDVLKDFLGASSEADLNIDYVIVPDREHNMAAAVYKEKFPHAKVIGPEKTERVKLDVTFTEKEANKLISGASLSQLVDGDRVIVDNFDFVYLPYHANSELVVFEKSSKTLFEADLLFNLGAKGPLEQFSPATGFPENYNPHTGWSYITRYMQPYSKIGRFMFRKIVNVSKSKSGLEAIASLDFDTIVMSHGNIITTDAKEAFKHDFLS